MTTPDPKALVEARERADALLKAVRRFLYEEARHATEVEREHQAAGGYAHQADIRHSRDNVDFAHANLCGDFNIRDVDAARLLLAAPAPPPKDGPALDREVSNADWYAEINQGRRGPPHPTDEQITAMRIKLAALAAGEG